MIEYLDFLIEFHKAYFLLTIPAVLIIQGIGIPTGTTFIMIFTGALAYIFEQNVFLVILYVWLMASIADFLSFLFWKKFGEKILKKPWRISKALNLKVKKFKSFMNKYGGVSITLSRFPLGVMALVTNITSALSKYKTKKFIAFCIIGEFMWSSVYIGVGFWFGDAWQTAYVIVQDIGILLIYLIVLMAGIYAIVRSIGSYKKNHPKKI
jgi:membrane-associated protein